MKRTTGYCDPVDLNVYGKNVEVVNPPPGEQANVVSSFLRPGWHAPVLDIDLPCFAVPSSTPGHFHLYIDHEVPEVEYFELLRALERCGIIEHGFVVNAEHRGQTIVRMPWVSKTPPSPATEKPEPIEEPF